MVVSGLEKPLGRNDNSWGCHFVCPHCHLKKKITTAPEIVRAVLAWAFGRCYFGAWCSFRQLTFGFLPFGLVFVLVISLTLLVLQ